MRLKPINSIREGDILGKTLYTAQGLVLLKEGTLLNQLHIMRIKAHGYYSIYIKDDIAVQVEEIVRPQLRRKAVQCLENIFVNFGRYNQLKQNGGHIDPEMEKVIKSQMATDVDLIAGELVEEVLCNRDVAVSIADIRSMDIYTYQHSVSVCIMAVVLGIEMELSRNQLKDLAIGALLHDIGKTLVSTELIMSPKILKDEALDAVRAHAQLGFDYIKDNERIPRIAKLIVHQHHEKQNGKGYPRALQGDEIHRYAKAVAICDVYDALTSDRSYRRAVSPGYALEYLMSNAGIEFDYDLTCLFIKKILPFPVGSKVELSNGEIAVVEKLNKYLPLRPTVRIWNSEICYDLAECNNLTIKMMLLEEVDDSSQLG